MAIQQIARVLRLPKGACTRRERNVLITLADTAHADGSGIFAGEAQLAARAGIAPRVFRLAMASLRARGWIEAIRPGGGRTTHGPRRTIWRLVIPTLHQQLPRPEKANGSNGLLTFPQTFPQVMHNPDQTIRVNPDRTILVNPDQTIQQEVAQTPARAAACAVEKDRTRPVRTRPVQITRPQEEDLLTLSEADQNAERERLAGLEQLRLTMAKCASLPVRPSRRARRRGGAS